MSTSAFVGNEMPDQDLTFKKTNSFSVLMLPCPDVFHFINNKVLAINKGMYLYTGRNHAISMLGVYLDINVHILQHVVPS
jgi:hypothetical protein